MKRALLFLVALSICARAHAQDLDRFGVRKLNVTAPGGREWYLPETADAPNGEWMPGTTVTKTAEPGVFHTTGNGAEAQVRFAVRSPAGRAWWRNVELTLYARATERIGTGTPHWSLQARGERHTAQTVYGSSVNAGVAAPAGTVTWPWYRDMKAADKLNQACLATSYHGNLYEDGQVTLEKETSHIEGYSRPRGTRYVSNWTPVLGRWVGYKFVLRNFVSDPQKVRLEVWIDAGGTWTKVVSYNDFPGNWTAANQNVNGCGLPPYSYAADQIITWAGPWLIFRADSMGMDFRWLSAREIKPLP